MLLVDIRFYCLYSNLLPLSQRDVLIISYTEPDQLGPQTLATLLVPFCVSSPLFLWVGCASLFVEL